MMKHLRRMTLLYLAAVACYAQINYNVSLVGQLNNHHATGGSANNYYSEVWGWTDTVNHREYAFIGAYDGSSIVDITDTIKEVGFITGPHNTYNYHEFRTYQNFLYIGAEGNDTTRNAGIQIVDLGPMPGSPPVLKKNLVWRDTSITNVITKYYAAHTVEAEGKYLYVNGGGGTGTIPGFGGIRIYDLTDPLNPAQAGTYGKASSPYVHDSFIRHDTIFAAAINDGTLNILDARNKGAIKIIGNPVPTIPEGRTHNAWTTGDGKYVMTASEVNGGHLHIYDIHDPTAPVEVAAWTSNASTSIHNVFINGDFAYIAYYSEGLRILDIKNPTIPIEVGFYDTHPGAILTTFEGAWGAYPYFPSGKIAVSDMNTGLYILSFNKKHGGQITGVVRNASTNLPLDSVQVTVLDAGRNYSGSASGQYKYGAAEGKTAIRYTRKGFITRTDTVTITAGHLDTVNVLLTPGAVVEVGHGSQQFPGKFSLEQNYPNPFNPTTHIDYFLPNPGLVTLRISDILGRELLTIVNEVQREGAHTAFVDASSLPSGMYFYRLTQGSFNSSKSMLLLK